MEKYGFVYIWYDRKHKRYYIGCHWGSIDDGYICSSSWMKTAYLRRPHDFKRKILKTNLSRTEMYIEEQRYFDMIKPEEIKIKYYNLSLSSKNPWHKYPESVKTVGQKISYSKTGKTIGSCSPEKAAKISEAKKKKFAERGGMTEEHREALRQAKLGTKRSEEAKRKTSESLKKCWSDGTRKRPEPKQKMTREEQDKLCSVQLAKRWSNPEWAERQRNKLKEAWAKRKNKELINSIEY